MKVTLKTVIALMLISGMAYGQERIPFGNPGKPVAPSAPTVTVPPVEMPPAAMTPAIVSQPMPTSGADHPAVDNQAIAQATVDAMAPVINKLTDAVNQLIIIQKNQAESQARIQITQAEKPPPPPPTPPEIQPCNGVNCSYASNLQSALSRISVLEAKLNRQPEGVKPPVFNKVKRIISVSEAKQTGMAIAYDVNGKGYWHQDPEWVKEYAAAVPPKPQEIVAPTPMPMQAAIPQSFSYMPMSGFAGQEQAYGSSPSVGASSGFTAASGSCLNGTGSCNSGAGTGIFGGPGIFSGPGLFGGMFR